MTNASPASLQKLPRRPLSHALKYTEDEMSTLERAISIAAEAHAGQVDKAGAPYILHPLRVMMAMDTDEERIVAVLHDVVEDCPRWSLSLLEAEGFNGGLVWSIGCLTRLKHESYENYIDRCGEHDRARKVK